MWFMFIMAFIFLLSLMTLLDQSTQYVDWSQVFHFVGAAMNNWVMLLLIILAPLPFAARYVMRMMDKIK